MTTTWKTITSMMGVSVAVLGAATAVSATAAAATLACPIPIGVAKGDVGKAKGAGYVEIRSGCSTSKAFQRLSLPNARAGDNFGAAITNVRLQGTKAAEGGLLIGIPNYDVGKARNAGAIASYRATSSGYRLDQIITQDSPGIPGRAQAGAQFGSVLTSLIERADDTATLTVRVGLPRLDVGAAKDAGGVVVLDYYQSDLVEDLWSPQPKTSGLLTLSTPGVPGTPHAYDRFGAALGGQNLLTVGVPGRAVAGQPGAGAVVQSLTYGSASYIERRHPTWVSQRTTCVPGTPETGDHFGAALAGDWIGVPGEDLGGVADAGMVNRYLEGKECSSLTEQSEGFQGVSHAGDRFGAALYEEHYYYEGYYHPLFLAIGAPGADTTDGKNSGTLNWVSERGEYEDVPNAVVPGRIRQIARGHTTGSRPTAGAALGTALGGGTTLYASAPGGPGVVYRFDYGKKSLTERDVYLRPAGLRPGAYGTALVGFL